MIKHVQALFSVRVGILSQEVYGSIGSIFTVDFDANSVQSTIGTISQDLCDFGWFYFRGGCYSLTPVVEADSMSWEEARAWCSKGGNLATIESSEKQAFLSSQFPDNLWIGFNDIDGDGTYHWLDSDSTFVNWGADS